MSTVYSRFLIAILVKRFLFILSATCLPCVCLGCVYREPQHHHQNDSRVMPFDFMESRNRVASRPTLVLSDPAARVETKTLRKKPQLC